MTKDSRPEYRSILAERGQPVHGRSLEIEVLRHDPDRVRVKGAIVDLRKQGFVPTGGDLQTSGIIHHMLLDAIVRRSDLMLESLEPLQPVVAYEPSEATGGESCRDIAWRIPELAGRPLDASFSKWLSAGFGGPLGCSHLLALAHVLAATTPYALALDKDRFSGEDAEREDGERLFKRSLVLDGFEFSDSGRLQIIAQLNDVHTRPQRHLGICQGLLRIPQRHLGICQGSLWPPQSHLGIRQGPLWTAAAAPWDLPRTPLAAAAAPWYLPRPL